MASYKITRRFFLIMELLRDGRSASFAKIRKHLNENDIDVSERTLQRDFQQIRSDYGVDIVYDSQTNAYHVDQESSRTLDGFYAYLELNLTVDLLKESLGRNRDILKHVQFDMIHAANGTDHLKTLLKAIMLQRWVSFSYSKYVEEGSRRHTVIPCLLKRYQNRWFLIGKVGKDNVLTFGLDRMEKLEVQEKTFKETDFVIPELLQNVVGINYSGEPATVKLWASALQAKYLESVPLHASQQIISSSPDGTIFEYDLRLNYELLQAILGLGDQVKVLEPEEFVEDVKRALEGALGLYYR